jgi:hypothetical protein
MDDNERRRVDMFIRVRQFGADNAADFPAGSIGATQFAVIDEVLSETEQSAADQAASFGDARQLFIGKDTARENLREDLSEIVRTARSMDYQFDGIAAKFKMPRSQSDQNLLATARAFHSESETYYTDFQNYGLDKLFRAELLTAIEAFEETLNPTGTAIDEQVAATAQIGAAIRRGMIARRILEGVVKNKYRSNVGKLAEWLSASHIERPPKKHEVLPTT